MIKKLGSISRTKSLHPRISAIRATHFSLLDSPRQMKPSTLFKPLSHNPTTAPFLAFRPGLSFKFGEFREIPSTRLRPCSFIFPPPLSAHTCIKGFLAILFPCEDSRHPLLPACHSSVLKLNHDQLIASLKRDLERLLRSWWILVWSIWDYKFWKTFVDYLSMIEIFIFDCCDFFFLFHDNETARNIVIVNWTSSWQFLELFIRRFASIDVSERNFENQQFWHW